MITYSSIICMLIMASFELALLGMSLKVPFRPFIRRPRVVEESFDAELALAVGDGATMDTGRTTRYQLSHTVVSLVRGRYVGCSECCPWRKRGATGALSINAVLRWD